jgi:hypothetical protein
MTLDLCPEELIRILEANNRTHHNHIVNATDINRLIIKLNRRIKRLEAQLDMHLMEHGSNSPAEPSMEGKV